MIAAGFEGRVGEGEGEFEAGSGYFEKVIFAPSGRVLPLPNFW